MGAFLYSTVIIISKNMIKYTYNQFYLNTQTAHQHLILSSVIPACHYKGLENPFTH